MNGKRDCKNCIHKVPVFDEEEGIWRGAECDSWDCNFVSRAEALKAYEGRPQGEWFSVSERLPEERINPYTKDFEYVLCSTTWGDVRPYKFGKRIGENKAHFWLAGAIMDKYITAWQPFPESYKEEGAE